MIDQYRVSLKPNGATQWVRITEFCDSLKLKLDTDDACSELTFSYPHGSADPNLEDLNLTAADKIIVWNTATNTKIFDGQVTKVDISGSVTCKDQGFYLKNPIYCKATKKRADTILKSICSKAGVSYGGTKLATKITVSFANQSASDCVQTVLEKLENKTSKRYWAHFVDKKLVVDTFQTSAHTIKVQRNEDWDAFDCTMALTDISGSESMEDYVTLVYATAEKNSKTKAYAKAVNNSGKSRYGKLIEYVTTDSKSEAASTARKSLLEDSQLKRECKCTMYASDAIVPGVRLSFDGSESTDIRGEFWVTAAEHDLTPPHTVSVTLERTSEDYVKASVSTMNTTLAVSSSSSSSTSGSSATTTVYTGKTVPAVYTAYYPSNSRQEGGYKDVMGNSLKATYLDKGILECAAPKSVKLKSRIQVKSTGTSKDGKVYLVADRGGAITVKNGVYHFDLLMANKSQANAWGKRSGKALLITGSKTVTSSGSGTSATAKKVLAYAKSQMGKNLNPGFAWCAWFVSRCCRKCGVATSVVPSTKSVSEFLSWAKSHGRYHAKGSGYVPQPGDIFIEKINKSHTGFVYKVSSDGKSYTTIEGNASNRVRSNNRTTSYTHLSGFFHPNW